MLALIIDPDHHEPVGLLLHNGGRVKSVWHSCYVLKASLGTLMLRHNYKWAKIATTELVMTWELGIRSFQDD